MIWMHIIRVMCIRKFFFLCTHNIKDPYRHLRCKADTSISRRVLLIVPPHFIFLMRERSWIRYRILGRWVDTCTYNCKGKESNSRDTVRRWLEGQGCGRDVAILSSRPQDGCIYPVKESVMHIILSPFFQGPRGMPW